MVILKKYIYNENNKIKVKRQIRWSVVGKELHVINHFERIRFYLVILHSRNYLTFEIGT